MIISKKLVAGVAAVVGLGFGGLTMQSIAQSPTVQPGRGMHRGGGERHPELRRALASLVRTENQLRHSARDFGGHREKAADLCHQAQLEIQQALQSDKN